MKKQGEYQALPEYQYKSEEICNGAFIGSKNSDGRYNLLKQENDIEYIIKGAKLAASCLILPNEGDFVQYIVIQNQVYIMAVLEKMLPIPSEYRLQGKVTLGIDESQMVLDAHRIKMKSPSVEMTSKKYKNKTNFKKDISRNAITTVIKKNKLEAGSQHQIIKKNNITESDQEIEQSNIKNVNTNHFNINTRNY